MLTYRELVALGNGFIIGATCFGLGAIYGNFPYDYATLWAGAPSPEAFEALLAHYVKWGNVPRFVYHMLHFVVGVGLLGLFIKLYKPTGDAKLFEYGSLFLFMVGVIIYLTNVRTGVNAAVAGEWGDVDAYTGVNVIAASEVMAVVALIGVLVLQGGLWYANWENRTIQEKYAAAEAAAAGATPEKAPEPVKEETEEATASATPTPKKTRARKAKK